MNQRSIIDYIIVRQRTSFKIYDCRVKRGANCGTDHHLLLATFVSQYSNISIQKTNVLKDKEEKGTQFTTKQYKLYLLHQESIRSMYEKRLATELTKVDEKTTWKKNTRK